MQRLTGPLVSPPAGEQGPGGRRRRFATSATTNYWRKSPRAVWGSSIRPDRSVSTICVPEPARLASYPCGEERSGNCPVPRAKLAVKYRLVLLELREARLERIGRFSFSHHVLTSGRPFMYYRIR